MKLGVGVVGLGFMGRTHVAAWQDAGGAGFDNELVAVCDAAAVIAAGGRSGRGNLESAGASGTLFDPARVRAYEKAADLFADSGVHVVSICTPTPTHVELASLALAAGKHVLVEKPLAIRAADAEALADAAVRARTYCMPAMCMRFWPGWAWLAERIRAGTFGAVQSAVFRRLGSRPSWSKGFYEDYAQSGGALFDLHVHDADFVRWALGAPARVISAGNLDHVSTVYAYSKGPKHVVAEGGWDHADGFPFQMSFTVAFEQATADYDFRRTPKLIVAHGGRVEEVAIESTTGYDGEVRHLCDVIAGKTDLAATCGQAAALVRMLEAERKSLESGAAVKLG
ncbi:MAG TPA: Gfo/Idh/MocA family oxidoreductase [Planctomycetota bacterium]|jgi:predicted dehydrogenase|nr:Gfo/Idh/MocA family oxidoreductase [Planctomycetota bacterium]